MLPPQKPKKGQTRGNHPQVQGTSGHGGMVSAKIDPVSRNAIWKEHCLKEEAKHRLSSEFSINPSTLVYIAEKPSKYKPSITLTQEEIDEAKQLLASVFMSNETDLTPTEKYELPQTASQEYGWCSRPFMEPDPFFNFPHKGCAITKFAAAYQECMHRSPYARRNPVDQHVAKSGVDYAHTGVNTSRIGSPSVTSSAQASSINARGKSYSKVPPDSSLPQVQESAVKEESVPAAA
ncbi:hypothetical protein KP509_08G068400 [Ceratopteris richardii]|uniref:Uncharacterized protein n=1 Tax=Ceratopteris richardii TaxID=49495 RepID=A0A8T2U8X1_CERRI|nr:hypothetical protein KP509_08G068400 [Ceratopteris richardii]